MSSISSHRSHRAAAERRDALAAALAPLLRADLDPSVALILSRRLHELGAVPVDVLRDHAAPERLQEAVLTAEAVIGPRTPVAPPGDVSCTDLSLATAGAIHGPCSPGGRS